jgi:L-amino acid N-acyltransferase YncA
LREQALTTKPETMARLSKTPLPAVAIRDAAATDIGAIQEIYAHHVTHGLGSFEETPPDAAEMEARWQLVAARGLPYLVAELTEVCGEAAASTIAGYAYAGTFRPRTAYRYTVENSVYVRPGLGRRGIGRVLLETLIERCTDCGMRHMVAVIGDSANAASIGLHSALGFRVAGTLAGLGFKHGRWVDSVIMQRRLGPGAETLPDN